MSSWMFCYNESLLALNALNILFFACVENNKRQCSGLSTASPSSSKVIMTSKQNIHQIFFWHLCMKVDQKGDGIVEFIEAYVFVSVVTEGHADVVHCASWLWHGLFSLVGCLSTSLNFFAFIMCCSYHYCLFEHHLQQLWLPLHLNVLCSLSKLSEDVVGTNKWADSSATFFYRKCCYISVWFFFLHEMWTIFGWVKNWNEESNLENSSTPCIFFFDPCWASWFHFIRFWGSSVGWLRDLFVWWNRSVC